MSKYFKMKVEKKVWETKDTASFYLQPLDKDYDSSYEPGQYLTVIADIKNQETPRSYSFSSTPKVDPYLRFTARRVQDGLMSNHLLDHIQQGDELRVTPITGEFYHKEDVKNADSNFHLYAAGSGITPILSILKDILYHSKSTKVDLVYSNKSYDNVIFKDEILKLASEFEDRFKVHWFFTQSKGDMKDALEQRLSGVSIFSLSQKQFFPFVEENTFVYMCGPSGFMSAVEKYYKSSLSKCQLRKESFDIEDNFTQMSESAKESSEKVFIGSNYKAVNSKVIAEIDGETVEVECSEEESLLDALLTAGENPPFSCMSGACMACMAVVEEGQVFQEDAGILVEENLKKNETLTCQARAISPVVKIKYEDFL
ncbi:MAG: iron-sulfur cluster-binding domain-containing protein [Bdellovibrionales bacterium]|nr:iron-sulfur cluster-binding domain-containing protein [Bdellovibrionales bacterium]